MRRPRNPGSSRTPLPGPRRDAPSPISPNFSRRPFAAAADDVSERPLVSLVEWWLERVEGHERKIAVAGFFERKQVTMEFTPVPIAKRLEPCVLETEDGIVVTIRGSFDIDRTVDNGFPIELCQEFLLGFPHWWENWSSQYPNSSSRTSKSNEDSTRFYLKQFQLGKLISSLGSIICNPGSNAEAFSGSDAEAFPDSFLPDGTPRFEEYTRDDDIPMHEKAAASNCDSERCADVCSEVENMEAVLIGGSTSNERSRDGIESNEPSAAEVECTNEEDNAGGDHASNINKGLQKTPVASMKRRGRMKKPQSIALNEKAILGETTPTLAPSKVQSSGEHKSPLTCGWPKSLSVSTPESLKLKKTRSGRVVVPPLNAGCQSIAYAHDGSISAIIGADSPPPRKGSTSKVYARKNKRTR